MDERDFRDYVLSFNENDFEGFGRYYAEDVVFELGDRLRLDGREAILDFYREVAEGVRETLTIEEVIVDEDAIAAELVTEFVARKDLPDFIVGPMEEDDTIELISFVHYRVEDGKFAHVKSARFKVL